MSLSEKVALAFITLGLLVGYLLGFRHGRHSGEMHAYDKLRQNFGENRFTRDLPRRS